MEEFNFKNVSGDQNYAAVSFLTSSDSLIKEKDIYGTCIVRGVFKDEKSAKEKAVEIISKQNKKTLFKEIHIVEVGKPFPICGDPYRFSEKVKILHEDIDGKLLNANDEDVINRDLFDNNIPEDSVELQFIKNCNIAGDLKENIKTLTESLKNRLDKINELKTHKDIVEKSINMVSEDKIISDDIKKSICDKIKYFTS